MFKTIEKVLFLHEVDLFSLAQTEHLGELAAVCRPREFRAGEILFRDGEPCKSLLIVVEGRIRLGDDEAAPTASKGSTLDEWAFLAESPHAASACVLEDSVLLEISSEDFTDILMAEPELCLALLKYLARHGPTSGSFAQNRKDATGRDVPLAKF